MTIVRFAVPEDVLALFELILALADYENLSHEVRGTPEALREHLFGDRPYAEALIAETNDRAVGLALFFHNYSTFLTQPGIYLEDLFVLPAFRKQGIGKLLLRSLARVAANRNCGRLEWSVLNWNEPAIGFYRRMGAEILEEWRICRVTGDSLQALAAESVCDP